MSRTIKTLVQTKERDYLVLTNAIENINDNTESSQDVSKNTTIAKSTLLMTIGTLFSRVTGLLRTWMMAYALGATTIASSYQIANNLPNIIYEVIAGGMIAAAFLPVLMSVKANGSKEDVNNYNSNILNIVFVVLGIISIVSIFAAEPLVATQTFTTDSDTEIVSTAVGLFRIFAIQILFYGLIGVVQVMLNADRSYFLAAFAPAINNIVVIISFIAYSIIVSSDAQLALFVLAVGTTLGVIINLLVLLPSIIKSGFKLKLGINFKDPRLIETIKLSLPTLLYVFTSIVISSCKNAFSIVPTDSGPAMIAYAWMWFQLPYGVLCVSLSRTMFTEMSEAAAQKDKKRLRKYTIDGISNTLLMIIPMCVVLIAMSVPLVTMFKAGEFSAEDVAMVSQLLKIWALGLPFYAVMMYLYNVFASIKKFWSYAILNVILTAGLIVLYWILTQTTLGLNGIAIADVCYYIAYSIISYVMLNKYVGKLNIRSMIKPIIKVVCASVVAYIVMQGINLLLPYPDNMVMAMVDIVIGGVAGLIVAYGLCYLLKVDAIVNIVGRFIPKLRK